MEAIKAESMRILYCTENQLIHKAGVWFSEIILYRLQEALGRHKCSL